MPTLSSLITVIQDILQDSAYTNEKVPALINAQVLKITAGIRMPDGSISPPLPDLMDYDTVTTTALAYVSLPSDYQRKVFMILDSSGNRIEPPRGGDYYAFSLFLKSLSDKRMTESGSVYRVAVKGTKLYYQGIPTTAEALGLHYYRKPVDMALDGDVPDGIPEHLAEDLIKHGVIKDEYGDKIEAGVTEPSRGMQYHTNKFFEAMTNLIDFIGVDGEPQYYGEGSSEDAGICD